LSPIQTRRGMNIAAAAQSPKSRSRRCCETMIFVPSSFIQLSEPIARGTVTGQRNSRTPLRASCPTSRTSEHSRAGARRCDVRMFGCLPAAPRRPLAEDAFARFLPHEHPNTQERAREAVCLPDCGRTWRRRGDWHDQLGCRPWLALRDRPGEAVGALHFVLSSSQRPG
jgi:hypothetical protein